MRRKSVISLLFAALLYFGLFVFPGLVQAERFYITQGLGCESWVVFLSSQTEEIYPEYDTYGSDGVVSEERLQVWAKPRDITYWPTA